VPDDEYREPGEGRADEDGYFPGEGAGAHVAVARGVDVAYGFGYVRVAVVFFVGGVGHLGFE